MAEAEPVLIGGLGGRGPRWTWDHSVERPAGEKDMGGWTAAVYTEEQQKRMGVDEMGNPVKKEEKKIVGGLSGMGPRWTWDPEFEKPAGEKDMGGWTASIYTEEQQKRLGVDEMGKPAEKKEETNAPECSVCCMGPRWTWDPEFEKPNVRKDMGSWTATVYSIEQQQRLGIDEMGLPNRLTPQAFSEKVYGALCRDALIAQYNSNKGDFSQVFGEDFKPLDFMKGDSDYDRLMKVDEFVAWAQAQDRSKEGIERPWEVNAAQLADKLFAGADEAGLTKKEFVQKYPKYEREFQHVFKVEAIRWGDFRKGDVDKDKHLSREEFMVWASVQDGKGKVVAAKAGDKAEAGKKDSASNTEVEAIARKVFGSFSLATMRAQYEYFTSDFKDQFGENMQNLDFMKGDADYDRFTSKVEFLDWVLAQNKDKEGVERPWEMSAEKLADLMFENKPDGISSKEFAEEYKSRKQTFDTLMKGKLMFSDFRKGDENKDRTLSREEFLNFITKKQSESLQNKE